MLDSLRKWLGNLGSEKTDYRHEYRDPWRERTTLKERGELPRPTDYGPTPRTSRKQSPEAWIKETAGPDPSPEELRSARMVLARAKHKNLSPEEALYYEEALEKVLRRVHSAEPARFVEVFVYWRIARDGKPTVSICDDPMGHSHAHLVRVPIPEDVQRCIAAVKNPPLCMVLEKTGKHASECPKPTNETSAP